jgi:hypothetical protein
MHTSAHTQIQNMYVHLVKELYAHIALHWVTYVGVHLLVCARGL